MAYQKITSPKEAAAVALMTNGGIDSAALLGHMNFQFENIFSVQRTVPCTPHRVLIMNVGNGVCGSWS